MIAKASTGERDLDHAGPLDAHTVRATMATTAVGFAVAAAPAEDGQLPYSLVVAAGDSSALILSSGRWQPVTAVKNAGSELAVQRGPRLAQRGPGRRRSPDTCSQVRHWWWSPTGSATPWARAPGRSASSSRHTGRVRRTCSRSPRTRVLPARIHRRPDRGSRVAQAGAAAVETGAARSARSPARTGDAARNPDGKATSGAATTRLSVQRVTRSARVPMVGRGRKRRLARWRCRCPRSALPRYLTQGGTAKIYRLPGYSLPGEGPLIYKEYLPKTRQAAARRCARACWPSWSSGPRSRPTSGPSWISARSGRCVVATADGRLKGS